MLMTSLALCLAMAIDRWLGEPPVRFHPVVWMGRYLAWAGQLAPNAPVLEIQRNLAHFVAAALAWLVGAALVVAIAFGAQQLLLSAPLWLAIPGLALLLKPMLAWRMLREEVLAVEAALGVSIEQGRTQLSRLVSRDTSTLDAAQVREAAIESLAENFNDSVIAPIFWFTLLGLPGAALYRFANTADAMWGYPGMRQGRWWQWSGKWAARADDALSWLPARLTGLLLLGANGRLLLLPKLREQASLTPSPNSGWPMAAMALLLHVRLCKPNTYALNADAPAPEARHTLQSVIFLQKSLVAAVFIALFAILFVAIAWL